MNRHTRLMLLVVVAAQACGVRFFSGQHLGMIQRPLPRDVTSMTRGWPFFSAKGRAAYWVTALRLLTLSPTGVATTQQTGVSLGRGR